jgi:hypothetical protein
MEVVGSEVGKHDIDLYHMRVPQLSFVLRECALDSAKSKPSEVQRKAQVM